MQLLQRLPGEPVIYLLLGELVSLDTASKETSRVGIGGLALISFKIVLPI